MESLQDILLETIEPSYDEKPQPEYILSGSGFGWYYSDTRRTMIRLRRGSECIVFEDNIDSPSKVLVQVGNEILYIDPKEILEVGWN
tara:strand:+ start:3531 stop:3791 length:261 start_codon:yes stop_codon:yes gene_type:complete